MNPIRRSITHLISGANIMLYQGLGPIPTSGPQVDSGPITTGYTPKDHQNRPGQGRGCSSSTVTEQPVTHKKNIRAK